MRTGGGGYPAKDFDPNHTEEQYNCLKGYSALEEVAILGRFGAKYEKIALCPICVGLTWGKRTGLHVDFGAKCAKSLTHKPIKL